MAWIESHQRLLSHPKTLNLMNLMGWDIDTTIGKLQRFWWWCIDYAPDGDLRRHNSLNLGTAVGLSRKKADQFVNAMIDCRWLDKDPYFRVHDWWEYAGPFLQTKHKRHPEVWQRVRDLYQGQFSTDDKGQLLPCNTSTPAQNDAISTVQAEQAHPSSTGTAEQSDNYSTSETDQMHQCSTVPAEQNNRCSTSDNVQTHRYCAVPPHLTKPHLTIPDPTIPNIANQQQQQQPNDFQICQNSQEPDRHQHEPSPTQPMPNGAKADVAGPADFADPAESSSEQVQQDLHTRAIRTDPESALHKIIRDRIGRHMHLSRCDMYKIVNLKNKHGPSFFAACDSLHSGVTNPASYLLAILEPDNANDELARNLKELAEKRGITGGQRQGEGDDWSQDVRC